MNHKNDDLIIAVALAAIIIAAIFYMILSNVKRVEPSTTQPGTVKQLQLNIPKTVDDDELQPAAKADQLNRANNQSVER